MIEKMGLEDADTHRTDYLVTCSNTPECRRSLDAKDRTFGQAVVYLKAKGWIVRKQYGTWMHYCPECRPNLPSIPVEY